MVGVLHGRDEISDGEHKKCGQETLKCKSMHASAHISYLGFFSGVIGWNCLSKGTMNAIPLGMRPLEA
jgi:hypothetical protein